MKEEYIFGRSAIGIHPSWLFQKELKAFREGPFRRFRRRIERQGGGKTWLVHRETESGPAQERNSRRGKERKRKEKKRRRKEKEANVWRLYVLRVNNRWAGPGGTLTQLGANLAKVIKRLKAGWKGP